jgi:hydroxymethylpyrimidine pyrophosphatase-like HAD family hydrolase
MTFRALVLDIDGTLLDSQGLLRPRVLAALDAVREAGIILLVATALPQRFARTKLAAAPGLCDRGVFLGGAHLVDDPTGYSHEVHFAPTVAPALIHSLLEADPELQILVQTGPDHHALRLPLPEEVLAAWGYPPDALIPFSRAGAGPCAKIVAWHERLDLRPLCTTLQSRFAGRAWLYPSEDGHWVQATAWEATKGQGLLRLLTHLGIVPADVAALGDDLPDVDMFQVAGLAVAMGNAPACVQAEAAWVTATCDQDGAALAVERLLGPLA